MNNADSVPNETTQQIFSLMEMSWTRLGEVFHLRLQKRSSRRSCLDVFKTSLRHLAKMFSRNLQDVLPRRLQKLFRTSCKNVFNTSSRGFQEVLKTPSRNLQDVLIRTILFAFVIHLQKTSSRRLDQDQYIHLGHTSWRRLQDVFKISCKSVLKTSSRLLAKMSSRRFQDISSS